MSNPFDVPRSEVERPAEPARRGYGGPWRDGGRIVAEAGVEWPARCVHCNGTERLDIVTVGAAPTDDARWGPLMFCGGFAVVFWLYLVRPNGVVEVYGCRRHRLRAEVRGVLVWLVVAAAAAAAVAGTFQLTQPNLLLVALAAVTVGVRARTSLVRVRSADGTRLVVGGVGDAFRETLPGITPEVELRFRRAHEPTVDEDL